MTERDEAGGLLRRHGAGDDRRLEDRALRRTDLAVPQLREDPGRQQ